jgi:hypothetical protein
VLIWLCYIGSVAWSAVAISRGYRYCMVNGEEMARRRHWAPTVFFLSHVAFLPVVVSILRLMNCDYGKTSSDLICRNGSELECWDATHSTITAAALTLLLVYLATAGILGSASTEPKSDT